MAQTDDQKLQASLLDELNKSEVKVSGEAAEKMKENIVNDKGGGNYLGLGIHDVFIKTIELVKANSGTLGMQFNVESPDGTGRHTFWLSEAALPYTIENVSRLVVHNTPEEKKADARNFMSNITGAKELFDVAKEKLIDGVAVLSIRQSKTQTYVNKNKETVPSLETNLLVYRPKEDTQQAAATTVGGGTPVSEADKLNIPF